MHRYVLFAAAAALAGCSHQGAVTTATVVPNTAAGEVVLAPVGFWIDTPGDLWVDSNGVLWMGGVTGTRLGLLPADIPVLTNANIAAHLAAGDSLEIALSQIGVDRAQNAAVRDFAARMVNAHTQHLQQGREFLGNHGITPLMAPRDTSDAAAIARVMSRLTTAPAGPMFDRHFMGAEVMMHRHMLQELNAVRPKASDAVLQFIDQTTPIVQQHLTDAERVWRSVGGGTSAQ